MAKLNQQKSKVNLLMANKVESAKVIVELADGKAESAKVKIELPDGKLEL